MQTTACTDRVVGDILSSWRYDISGITPEMRRDYEQHLVECAHCLSRQRLHRTIDVVLIGLSTVSIAAFLLALAVIHRVQPLQHWALVDLHVWQMSIVLSLQAAAIAGLLISLMSGCWLRWLPRRRFILQKWHWRKRGCCRIASPKNCASD